jgi:hypothetical protein
VILKKKTRKAAENQDEGTNLPGMLKKQDEESGCSRSKNTGTA